MQESGVLIAWGDPPKSPTKNPNEVDESDEQRAMKIDSVAPFMIFLGNF